MADWMDSKMLNLLETGLDSLSLRNRVLSNNIANVDTPNFKRSDVNFERALQSAMGEKSGTMPLRQTSPKHIQTIQLQNNYVIQDNSTTYRNDGNNVDIDLEMTRLAENTLQYNALASALTSHLNLLRQVVRE